MSELYDNLIAIKNERNKLSPSVLKEGLTVFGITGTLQYMVKVFTTAVEMNAAASSLPEDTIGVVYGLSYGGTFRLDNGSWTQIGDSTDEQKVMNVLNQIDNIADQYTGNGGTDQEISDVLDQILGNGEVVE